MNELSGFFVEYMLCFQWPKIMFSRFVSVKNRIYVSILQEVFMINKRVQFLVFMLFHMNRVLPAEFSLKTTDIQNSLCFHL